MNFKLLFTLSLYEKLKLTQTSIKNQPSLSRKISKSILEGEYFFVGCKFESFTGISLLKLLNFDISIFVLPNVNLIYVEFHLNIPIKYLIEKFTGK